MDYGRDDERSWIARRTRPEGGWLEWLYGHAVLLGLGTLLGAALGFFWPMILGHLLAPHYGEASRWANVPEPVGEGMREMAATSAEAARSRALIGGSLGLVAAVGIGLAAVDRRPR